MAADAIDSLYQVPPAEFVKARNALAKSLKAAGQRADAERAAQLSRPTASVWASNQVARHAPDLLARLAGVTDRLQGGIQRDRERYAAAITEHRETLNELRARVEEILSGAALRVAPATVAAAVQNFRAGLMDARTRPLLEQGRLEQDVGLEAVGGVFGLTAATVSDDQPAPRHAAPAHDHAKERERREQERQQAKARAEAERRLQALEKAVHAAAATRAKSQAAVASARRDLERAERELTAAAAAEQEAVAALSAARSERQ